MAMADPRSKKKSIRNAIVGFRKTEARTDLQRIQSTHRIRDRRYIHSACSHFLTEIFDFDEIIGPLKLKILHHNAHLRKTEKKKNKSNRNVILILLLEYLCISHWLFAYCTTVSKKNSEMDQEICIRPNVQVLAHSISIPYHRTRSR